MSARVVIAGTASGVGKTSVACGLIAALRRSGLAVQGFKVGPDYIDPSHHALASGRPGRNLDAFLSGPELIGPLFAHGAQDAQVSVIEGVMGLFDGACPTGELASTAQVAKLLDAPVLLVLDAGAMARSAAAVVHGFRSFDPQVRLAGVILNRVGSERHEALLRQALAPLRVPVLGALTRREQLRAPERHLGLIPAGERRAQARRRIEALADAVREGVDLEGVLALARSAPRVCAPAWSPEPAEGAAPARGARVAVAAGPAFSFHYRENLELLAAAGAELVEFDPICDERLPAEAGALLLAGGFPEVYAAELEANETLRRAVREHAAGGRPILAECGGLLFLCRSLDGRRMCGVLSARASMGQRPTLGYREACAASATPWLALGARVRGHEFHYSRLEGSSPARSAWTLSAHGRRWPEGIVAGAVQASYLHVHWAAHPQLAVGFARAAVRATQGRLSARREAGSR